MYVKASNNPKKATQHKSHTYELKLGYIQGLLAQNNFPLLFTKH